MPQSRPVADALQDAVTRLVDEGRRRLLQASADGRRLLEARQLLRERDRLCIRLGKTAHRLVEAGEIQHPALEKLVARVQALDADLERLRAAPGGADAVDEALRSDDAPITP